jgi:hypothetical protein
MSDSTTSSVLRARKQELQYLLAGAISLTFVGATVLYPEFAGIEGTTGYLFLAVLVGYVFGLASDRLRQSKYYPLFQAIFFLSWGGYNVSQGRFGLLTRFSWLVELLHFSGRGISSHRMALRRQRILVGSVETHIYR